MTTSAKKSIERPATTIQHSWHQEVASTRGQVPGSVYVTFVLYLQSIHQVHHIIHYYKRAGDWRCSLHRPPPWLSVRLLITKDNG